MITFKKIAIKSKAGLALINYSHSISDQEIQNNGGCPEAAGPDWEKFLQPRKYQKYPHWSWLGNWLCVTPYSENPGLLLLKVQGVFTETLLFGYLVLNRTDKHTKIRIQIQPVIESIIQHARYGQQCCITAVPSLTPRHSKLKSFNKLVGPRTFQNPSRDII